MVSNSLSQMPDRPRSSLGDEHVRAGAAVFPGSKQVQRLGATTSIIAANPDSRHRATGDSWGRFFFATVEHTTFDPDWPIRPDWPSIIRGLRGSMQLSQAAFADICGYSRATVERWEADKALPLRGNALRLMSDIRPHLSGPVQVGQSLNILAAAVLPNLSKPNARYLGSELIAMLSDERDDHRDLGPALLGALESAQILVTVDRGSDEHDTLYIPVIRGVPLDDEEMTPWLAELTIYSKALSNADRALVMAVARRLSHHQQV